MDHFQHKYRFCPVCGGELRVQETDGRDRSLCLGCGWIDYRNPKPVVVCIVLNSREELLLIKRGIAPCEGKWALPGGFIETDEKLQDAGTRELKEETGLDGRDARVVGVHMQKSLTYGSILIVGLSLTITREVLTPGDDASDAAFFPTDELPEIPFESHLDLISACLSKEKHTFLKPGYFIAGKCS